MLEDSNPFEDLADLNDAGVDDGISARDLKKQETYSELDLLAVLREEPFFIGGFGRDNFPTDSVAFGSLAADFVDGDGKKGPVAKSNNRERFAIRIPAKASEAFRRDAPAPIPAFAPEFAPVPAFAPEFAPAHLEAEEDFVMMEGSEMDRFIAQTCVGDIEHVSSALSGIPGLLEEEVKKFIVNPDKTKLVIPILKSAHFTALIVDTTKAPVQITYFEPAMVDQGDERMPYHPLDEILTIMLHRNFPGHEMRMPKAKIQSYSVIQGSEDLVVFDNNYCGSFVWFFASGIASGEIEIDAEGNIDFMKDGASKLRISKNMEFDLEVSGYLGDAIKFLYENECTDDGPLSASVRDTLCVDLFNEFAALYPIFTSHLASAPAPAPAPTSAAGAAAGSSHGSGQGEEIQR